MRAGKLRHRITIQTNAPTQDGIGYPVESWSAITNGEMYANVVPLRGREYMEAKALQDEHTAVVTIRYRDDVAITPLLRVLHGSVTYDVMSVVDVGGRQRMLELMCREVTD